MELEKGSFLVSLLSGGVAGTAVDVSLYPLDTIKTRLQSPQGFWKAGGFRGVYQGLSAAATGSAPSASLFFSTYEFAKKFYKECYPEIPEALKNLLSGGTGEVVSASLIPN
jgi:solute carrier family 25 S-adenosylmethionine transporter 26